jgi:hypothetical protein
MRQGEGKEWEREREGRGRADKGESSSYNLLSRIGIKSLLLGKGGCLAMGMRFAASPENSLLALLVVCF